MDAVCSWTFMYFFLFITIAFLFKCLRNRYNWYYNVINKNPHTLTMTPVVTEKMSQEGRGELNQVAYAYPKAMAVRCTFHQYLKYLWLACVPYFWSVPIKYFIHLYKILFKSSLTEEAKRERLAKMVLETSLVLGFREKRSDDMYLFVYERFRMPTRKCEKKQFQYFSKCEVVVAVNKGNVPLLMDVNLDGKSLVGLGKMCAFLNTLWCVYTHTLTHIQAGNICDINNTGVTSNGDSDDGLKESIDDMHAAASGMNESANHYPADIWGIPRLNLQVILGYNCVQNIGNHHKILQCMGVSKFIQFTMQARQVYKKHLSKYNVNISTLSANTIFHSIDHYNMGKYYFHDSERKQFLGIESGIITSLLGDLNYDWGRWQGMKYTKYKVWRAIYEELRDIDEDLADKTHMFISV